MWANYCYASKITIQMNKLHFKDGKGDPQGFKTFLDNEKLPRGLLPRYRGNRLHILFHICGMFVQHHSFFKKYLEQGTACGGLRASILADFVSTLGQVEMQVLGLLGKFLTGPWMKLFVISAANQTDHVDGITTIKKVVQTLKDPTETPHEILSSRTDFFGKHLDEDPVIIALQEPPKDEALFLVMMTA